MAISLKVTGVFAGLLLASGCVVYPYETAFSDCDGEAGICYQYCEEVAQTPDYATCHADCDDEANQCFASAYDSYRYSGAQYGASSYSPYPRRWNGRYGSWYPDYGYSYFYGNFGRGYGYGRQRHRNPYYGPGVRRRQPGGNPPSAGSGNNGGGQSSPPPPQAQPPQGRPQPNAGKPPPKRQKPRQTPRTKGDPARDKD